MNLKTIFKEAWEKTFVNLMVRKRNLEDFIDNLPDIEIPQETSGHKHSFHPDIVSGLNVCKCGQVQNGPDTQQQGGNYFDDVRTSYKEGTICSYCGSHLEPKEICKCRINTGRDKPKENIVDKHINYGFNLLNKYRKAVEAKPKNICNHFKWSLAPSGKGVTCDGCGLYCGLTMEIEDKPKDWEVEFDKMLGKNYIHTQVTKAFIQELLDDKDREIAKYQRREDEHCRMLEEMEVKDSLFIDGVLYQRVATDID